MGLMLLEKTLHRTPKPLPSWEGIGYEPRSEPPPECNPAGALALDIPVSRAVRSKFLLFLQATPSVVFCYSSLNRVR